jgi:basic membrane protein A
MKGKKILAAILGLTLVGALLAGCGSGAASTAESTAASTAESTAQTGDAKLRVALLLPGSMNDGGWNAAAYNGLMELKDQGYECAFTEGVEIAAIEEAMRNYASEGYDLVIGHGAEFGEPAMRVAPEFPDVKFFVSGKLPDGVTEADIPANTGFMDMAEYEGAYLCGIIAGSLTESNILGYIAGLESANQLACLAGFVQGVAKTTPDAKVYGVVTGTFEDPNKGMEAANALIDMGADILAHSADSTGVGAVEVCKERNIPVFGYGGDQFDMAPDQMVCCFATDNKMVIESQAHLIEEGTFGGLWEPGVGDGVVGLTSYHNFEDKISDEVKQLVQDEIARAQNGEKLCEYTTDRIDEKL